MSDKKRVLILCTGNSARSQMAGACCGMMPESASRWKARAHSQAPCGRRQLPSCARRALISPVSAPSMWMNLPGQQFDYVITVCDYAREACPVFPGMAQKLHQNFEDPAAATGSEHQRLAVLRRVRDELRSYLRNFTSDT